MNIDIEYMASDTELSGSDIPAKFWFDKDFQERLCATLIRNQNVFIKLHELVKYDYFVDTFHKEVYKIAKAYYKTYRTIPFKEVIINELEKQMREKEKLADQAIYYRIRLNNLYSISLTDDEEYLQSQVRTFCRKLETIKMLSIFQRKIDEAKTEMELDAAIEYIRYNLRRGIKESENGLGVQVFSPDVDYRSLYTENTIHFRVPTGLKRFDENTMGGLGNGEVGTILGLAGVGKSQILVNFCKHGALTSCPTVGKNNEIIYNPVVYITQELSEEDVHTRFIASMTGIEISKLVKYRIEPKLLAKEEINQIEAALDSMKDMSKYVRIKYFKPKQLTPQKLADYLFEVEHCDKVKIRAVYHDYLKKLSYEGRAKDDYTGLGYITTELIGIAQDFCLPIWTPMQLNRGAKLGGFAGLQSSSANVGNSWQIIEDLDYVLIVEPIAENPEYMTIKVDKARRSEDNYKIQIRIRKNTCQIEECLVSPYSNDTDENEEEKYKQSLNGKGKKLSEQNASGWTWQRDEPSVF